MMDLEKRICEHAAAIMVARGDGRRPDDEINPDGDDQWVIEMAEAIINRVSALLLSTVGAQNA